MKNFLTQLAALLSLPILFINSFGGIIAFVWLILESEWTLIIQGIELIRAIENNLKLGTFITAGSGFAVDVNQDLMKAIDVMPKDKIRKLY